MKVLGFALVVFAIVCSGCKEAAVTPLAPADAPTIASISPIGTRLNATARTLTVTGSGFGTGTTIKFNAKAVPTTVVSATKATAQLQASDFSTAGNVAVTVVNSDGQSSAPSTFVVGSLKVSINHSVFDPLELSVPAGMDVEFSNDEHFAHTVTRDVTSKPGPDKPLIGFGEKYTFTVPDGTAQGNIFYHCEFHGTAGDGTKLGNGMVGVLKVQ